MLIHGRLILTASGFNLDEVKSLLQKSLRRKETDLVLQSCRELIGRGKDQLPWKSLVTFLYEDHCLSDVDVVRTLWRCYEEGEKYKAVELLLEAYTARHAACLPVIALRDEYHPATEWDVTMTVDEELKGLVTKKSGCINFDLLLAHLRKAWIEKNERGLVAYMKLASMAQDYDDRSVTGKGLAYLISGVACPNRAKGKPTPGLVVLSVLYKTSTTTPEMKQYLLYSFKLASLPDVCVRLVMCSAVTQLVHQDKVKKIDMKLGQIKWREVGKLPAMPEWAVDKHTFRGKNGKGTKHIVKAKRNAEMTDEEFENFHGERRKRGLKDFFEEGTMMNNQSCPGENPYWEETKKIYYEQPPKLQKTYRLTVNYYQRLKKDNKELMYVSEKQSGKSAENGKEAIDDAVTGTRALRKRTASTIDEKKKPESKKRKLDLSKEKMKDELKKKLLSGFSRSESDSESDFQESNPIKKTNSGIVPVDVPKGPLLQLPTGSAKVYTRLSTDQTKIWKGPYRRNRMNLVLFFHKALKDVLGDPHTLDVECQDLYLAFPILKAATVDKIQITKRDYTDVISKTEIKDGEFVLRESLGVVQCHRVGVEKLNKFPATFWVHFVWRFCLNVGDSGMYNAITDDKLSFLYGIDMEEYRKRVAENNLVGYLFSKAPAKPYVQEIWRCLRSHKADLEILVNKPVNYSSLDKLAVKYGVSYDRTLFIERIKLVRQAVKMI